MQVSVPEVAMHVWCVYDADGDYQYAYVEEDEREARRAARLIDGTVVKRPVYATPEIIELP